MPSIACPLSTVEELCERIPCEGYHKGVNKWVFWMFQLCAENRVDPNRAMEVIPTYATRTIPASELRRCCRKAYNADPDDVTPTRSPYSAVTLKTWMERLPFKMSSKWLIENSPASVEVSPGQYLNAIHPGRKVVVVNRYRAKGGFIYKDPAEDSEMSAFANGNRADKDGKAGAWFVSNAVNGEWAPAEWERDGTVTDWSLRSGENIVDWSYAVMESDEVNGADWCAMLVQQDLAIVSLTYSGNDSVHALVKTGATNRSQFQKFRKTLIERYTPLGLDSAAVREVQLTRLPNVVNNKTGRYQKLLWLDPVAEEKPIVNAENETGYGVTGA
jgi:hypothetical protein